MKKKRVVWLGILLSLTVAVTGMAGVTAQLQAVYAEEESKDGEIVESHEYGNIPEKEGFRIKEIYIPQEGSSPIRYIRQEDGSYVRIAQDGSAIVEEIAADQEVKVVYVSVSEADEEVAYAQAYDSEPFGQDASFPEEAAVLTAGIDSTEGAAAPMEEADSAQEDVASAEETDVTTEVVGGGEDPAATDDTAPAEETNLPEGGAALPEGTDPAEETVAPETETIPAEEAAAPAEVMAAPEEEGAQPENEAADAVEEVDKAEKSAPVATEAEEAKEDQELLKVGEKYTVTFDMQGHGTAPEKQEVESGKTATKPETDPTAEGYTFGGWYADKDGAAEYKFDEEITADVTVYAKWTPVPHTVTFATTRGTAPAAQTVNHGEKAAQPSLTDTGYTCTGWATEDGKPYDFATSVTADLKLTAVWRANKYTVHFDLNNTAYGTAVGATADLSCTYDTEARLTKNGFARNADWEFIGWNTAADGSGAAYPDQAAVKNLTAQDGATVTLYAQWRYIYRMVAGANASVSKLDARGLTFQTNGFHALFTGAAVDGTVISAANYTASAANYGTYITLKQDFIKTLSIGQHTIQFLYADGSVSTLFYVNNSTVLNPVQTGDNNHMALWVGLIAGAAVAAIGIAGLRKKFKQ